MPSLLLFVFVFRAVSETWFKCASQYAEWMNAATHEGAVAVTCGPAHAPVVIFYAVSLRANLEGRVTSSCVERQKSLAVRAILRNRFDSYTGWAVGNCLSEFAVTTRLCTTAHTFGNMGTLDGKVNGMPT